VPTSRKLKLARAIPGASVHEMDADHGVCINASQFFAPALLEACWPVAPAAAMAERSPRQTEVAGPCYHCPETPGSRPAGPGPPLGRRPRRRSAGHDIPAAERHLTDMDALDQLLKKIPRPVEPFEASHIGSMQHSHLHVHGHH
jgi:hypothetical protein